MQRSSEVGARPTQKLIVLSRMRRRDMARSFDSGGGSITDWVQLVSMPTTRSSAVLRCRVRIGGGSKFANLLRAEMR